MNDKFIQDLQLKILIDEHKEIDEQIIKLENLKSAQLEFKIKLLKKQKLSLKDKINEIISSTSPDIIA